MPLSFPRIWAPRFSKILQGQDRDTWDALKYGRFRPLTLTARCPIPVTTYGIAPTRAAVWRRGGLGWHKRGRRAAERAGVAVDRAAAHRGYQQAPRQTPPVDSAEYAEGEV